MLWASSMFSMLLATARAAVPTAHPALLLLAPMSQSCGNLEASLKRDGAPDICAVRCAARILDVATDRLQFGRKGLDVRLAEMGVFGYVCDGHRRLTHI